MSESRNTKKVKLRGREMWGGGGGQRTVALEAIASAGEVLY